MHNNADPHAAKITFRALAVGLLMAALLGVGAPYEHLIIFASPLHFDYSTPAAVFLFFLFFVLVNPLLGFLRRRWFFSKVELVTIYIMGAVACTIPTVGLVCVLIPHISAGSYFATPENEWASKVLPYIPSWLRVSDEQAIKFFYEGLPRGQAVPWEAWLQPMAAWTVLVVAFFGAMTAMMIIVRKQWLEHERLSFPLVQVPIAMIGAEGEEEGLILGHYAAGGLWILIDGFTGMTGNHLFYW